MKISTISKITSTIILLSSIMTLSEVTAQEYLAVAEAALQEGQEKYGLIESDIEQYILSDYHQSTPSGTHHHYFNQTYNGIKILNAVAGVHVMSSGVLLFETNRFQGKLNDRINDPSEMISATRAIEIGAFYGENNFSGESILISNESGSSQKQTYENSSISEDPIQIELKYFTTESGDIRLCWEYDLAMYSQSEVWKYFVDAETGEVLERMNMVTNCSHADYGGTAVYTPTTNKEHTHTTKCNHTMKTSPTEEKKSSASNMMMSEKYRIYKLPIESPGFGDRTLETDPHLTIASPYGWQDTNGVAGAEDTLSRGNNVDAFTGYTPTYRVGGGTNLNFDFSIDTTWSSSNRSIDASITNCFYLNNRFHDLWYLYGFTEAAGNFQENNYNKGGAASDRVNVRVQDPSRTCNGAFSTPADGQNPTHWVYTCSSGSQTPAHDGAYDSGVMGHEYAHGISNRLVGGPSNNTALNNNQEQMGEGWSDYYGLMTSMLSSHSGTDGRGRGTWNYQQPIDGPGNRAFRYSTDMTVNPDTYATVATVTYDPANNNTGVHRVGSIWCVMLWEMTWALIDEHGFTSNLENDWDQGGNTLALQLVTDALKLTAVNPGFVDGRDAILAADQALTGGENQCIIWEAFAKRGLGQNADQGSSSNRTDGTENFFVTETYSIDKSVDLDTAEPGDELTYTLVVRNNQQQTSSECESVLLTVLLRDTLPPNVTFVNGSASNGGSANNGVVTWPSFNLSVGASATRTFKVQVNNSYTPTADLIADDFENGLSDWTSSTGHWTENTTEKYSGAHSVFANNISSQSVQTFTYNNTFTPDDNTVLTFWHKYNTEARFDGGIVEVSTNGGNSWTDVGPLMIKNGYQGRIKHPYPNFSAGFSGDSGGFLETVVDLSSYDGKALNLRFVMTTDISISDEGWYIDLVRVDKDMLLNQGISNEQGINYNVISNTVQTRIENECNDLTVTSTADSGLGSLRDIVACASSGDVITFDPAINTMSIDLSTGHIEIDKSLTIKGNGITNTIVDGSAMDLERLFFVKIGNTVHFEDMTFQNGGSAAYAGFGGAIYTRGNTSILSCKFTGNNNSNVGCAILQNEGDLKIVNCEFSDNGLLSSGSNEAVIWKFGDADALEIYQSTFFGNDVAAVIIVFDGTINNISQNTFVDNNITSRVASFQNNGTNTFSNNVIEETEAPLFLYGFASVTAKNNISLSASGNLPAAQGNIVGSALLNLDYTLMSSSPAISAGDNASIPDDILDIDNDNNTTEDLPLDFAGTNRIQGCGTSVDIGAFEANDMGSGVVTNTRDSGYGSLRYEIECAASGSTITFDPAINTQLIQLTSGQINIDKDLTIQGKGVANTIVDGALDNNSRLFVVNSGKSVHFEGMTFQNGGSATFASAGAGLYTSGNTSILNCKFSNNNNSYVGNAILQFAGDLKVVNTEFSQNGLLGSGGNETVIWKQGGASTAQINQCVFWGNDVDYYEVLSFDGVSFDFSQNTMTNTNGDNLILLQGVGSNTINNNIVESTGNLFGLGGGATASTSSNLLEHTDAQLPSVDGNFVGDPMFVDASTGDLDLMSGSAAISAGDDMSIPADVLNVDNDSDITEALPTDYNGNTRVHACIVDIGAIEYQGNDMAIVVTNTNNDGPGSFRQALACAPSGSTITFDPSLDGMPIMLTSSSTGIANTNITVKGNSPGSTIIDASAGAGRIFFLSGRTVTFKDMTFRKTGGNTINELGAAFFLDNSTDLTLENVHILDCKTTNNGAVIHSQNGSTFDMYNCLIQGNEGSRIINEFAATTSTIEIEQCLFIENTAINDLVVVRSPVIISQNTFSDNVSNNYSVIYSTNSNTIISNNIFFNNTLNSSSAKHIDTPNGIASASSNICETPTDLPVASFITSDPLFVDAAANNFRLTACSPAIGRGDASAAPATDTEGHTRPTGFGVDIGWDEYTGAACPEGQCGMPVDIDCDATYTDDNYDGANTIDTYTGSGVSLSSQTGPEKIYKITTTDIGNITASAPNRGSTINLFILSDCADGTSTLASATGVNGNAVITNAPAGDYYIVFDGFQGATGDFTFSVDATCGHVPCTENIVMINTPEDPMGLYHAIDEIQSDATINNDATFKAGNHIDLNQGFEVTAGQVFEAIIEPCPN